MIGMPTTSADVIGMPTINAQIAAMDLAWPRFRVRRLDDRTTVWTGDLRPIFQVYEVEIRYKAPTILERLDPLRQQPNVSVLNPKLKRRNGDPEGPLPHVYWDDPQRPALCLFDFEASEWTPFDLLAETTVPWTLNWLACYEGWRASGVWTGGGRHLPPQLHGETRS